MQAPKWCTTNSPYFTGWRLYLWGHLLGDNHTHLVLIWEAKLRIGLQSLTIIMKHIAYTSAKRLALAPLHSLLVNTGDCHKPQINSPIGPLETSVLKGKVSFSVMALSMPIGWCVWGEEEEGVCVAWLQGAPMGAYERHV